MTGADRGLSLLLHVSNHGFGHAARAGVLAGALLDQPGVAALAIAVPESYRAFFARALRDPRCALVDVETDLGIPMRPGEFTPDAAYVAAELDAWLRSWPERLAEHEARLGGLRVDGVVVDASPLGCAIAARLDRPAVVVTNFEWHAQFRGLGMRGAAVDAVGEAYGRASAYLRYPLCLPSEALARVPTEDVPACARAATEASAAAIRASLPAPRLLVSLGGLVSLEAPFALPRFAGTVAHTQGIRVAAPRAGRVVDLSRTTDMISHVAAADLVVTKAGWSTVAEAAVASRPLLVLRRPVPEDRHIVAGIERLGLGRGCDLEDLAGAIDAAVEAGLAPTVGLRNDPAAVAGACLARLL